MGFNRRPDLTRPIDAEGGEKLDLMTGMLHALVIDARSRGVLQDDYYHFDDQALLSFRKAQSIPIEAQFAGTRLEQAFSIWSQTPRSTFKAVLGRLGVSVPDDYVQTDSFTVFDSPTDGEVLFVRFIPPAPFKNIPTDEDALSGE